MQEVGAPALAAVRLVAFDLDGTLIDSIGDIAASVNEALEERYGAGTRLSVDEVRGFVGSGARQLVERCLAAAGKPSADVDAVFARFLQIYRSRLVETTRLYPGVRAAVDAIWRRAALGVLTNKPGDMSRRIIQELLLTTRFIAVIGGDDFKTKKPDPLGLLSLGGLAGLRGVKPDHIALVGDSAVDVRTAKNAGAISIGVLWGYDRAGVIQEKPDFIVETPTELTCLFSSLGSPGPSPQ